MASNRDYYRNLGYNCNIKDVIQVDASEISHGSHIKIKVMCDICNENIYEMQIADYYRRIKDGKNEDYCPKCRHLLNEKTCIEKYGVKHPMQDKKIYLKCQNTLEEHYGVRYMQ